MNKQPTRLLIDASLQFDDFQDMSEFSASDQDFNEGVKPSRKVDRHSLKHKQKKSRWDYENDY